MIKDAIMPTYQRLDVAFEKGQGAWLTDTDGKRYLDAFSGVAVCNLGHAHPRVTAAISKQAATLIHTSNYYHIPLQQDLAKKLTALSGMTQAFFNNSGAEANETAIKIARKYSHQKGIDKPVIIVMEGSFHGRTMAALSATGNPKVQAGFAPLVSGFVRVPYNDVEALGMAINQFSEAVAVMVEPVQGEGGVRVPDCDYLAAIRRLCTEHQLLLMVDEVQTGIGRTGKWFAFQHAHNVLPDVMMLAKGLGNGLPIGACLVAGNAVGVLDAGSHGSTFGGNPLACRAALAVLDTIERDQLLANAFTLGAYIHDGLKKSLMDKKGVKNIRSLGLMLGIELAVPCRLIVKQALTMGILINVTADNVIRLLPPLIISKEDATQIIDKVSELVYHFLDNKQAEGAAG